MKVLSILFLTLICSFLNPLFGQKISTHTVYFEVDRYTITPEELASLEAFMQQEGNSDYISSIRISGHTDTDASSDYNLKLSQNRVKTVSAFIKKTLPAVKIQEEWLGEDQPLNNNSNAAEKQLNRRVVITIEYWVPDRVEETGTIRDLYALLEQQKQRICISPKGDTTIRLEQGTILYFPAEPFGKVDAPCIEIRAKEFYKLSDMLMENLSTTTNGRLLETTGMVYMEAAVGDKLLELQPGKEVVVMMPAVTLRDDMTGYNGERDPHTDIINWEAMETNPIRFQIPPGDACEQMNTDRPADNCERCTFFFCRFTRIDDGLKGIVNGNQHALNRSFRQCQRKLRRSRGAVNTTFPLTDEQMLNCMQLDSLFKKYNVTNRNALLEAMNKEQMEKYGVNTLAELGDTLRKIKLANIEQNLNKGIVDQYDLQYYMYSTNRMGWINSDALSKLPGNKITMNTDFKTDISSDCKILFTKVRGILPANAGANFFQFIGVPEGNEVWLIGMRFRNNQAYLSLKKVQTSQKVEMAPFREVTLEELKQALKELDR